MIKDEKELLWLDGRLRNELQNRSHFLLDPGLDANHGRELLQKLLARRQTAKLRVGCQISQHFAAAFAQGTQHRATCPWITRIARDNFREQLWPAGLAYFAQR